MGSSFFLTLDNNKGICNLEEDFSCQFDVFKLSKIDFCLFLGLNLRIESPILNSRMRLILLKIKLMFFLLDKNMI